MRPYYEMVACCRCNRTGSCRGCACVKAGKPCTNCLPSKMGTCLNVSATPATSTTTGTPSTPGTVSFSATAQVPVTPSASHELGMYPPSRSEMPDTHVTSATVSDLHQHQHSSNSCPPQLPTFQRMSTPAFSWGNLSAEDFAHALEATYSEVVHWKLNSFKVPSVRQERNSYRNCLECFLPSRLPLQWNLWHPRLPSSCPSCSFKSHIVDRRQRIMPIV